MLLTFWFFTKYHPLDDLTRRKTPTHYLDDSNVINVEVLGIRRHDGNRGFGNEIRKGVLITVLFRSDGGSESGG